MLKSEGGGGTCRAFTVSMARYGYASISSTDQDCSLQEARLRAEGCKVIRTEKASGKSRDGRDELARIMDFLHAGDELVVVKLDRLGRSTRDVLNLVHDLEAKGAALTVLEPIFSTKDAAGPIPRDRPGHGGRDGAQVQFRVWVGHDGWKGAQPCRDAKSLIFLMPSWTSCWLGAIPRRPLIRPAFLTA